MRLIISAFAILWLIVTGILIAAAGAAIAWQEATRTDSCIGIECGGRQLFLTFGLVGIAFGAAYLAAGIGLWRGRPRARLAGVVLAVAGLLLARDFGMTVPSYLGWAWAETGSVGLREWPAFLMLIANGVALVGLVIWKPPCRRVVLPAALSQPPRADRWATVCSTERVQKCAFRVRSCAMPVTQGDQGAAHNLAVGMQISPGWWAIGEAIRYGRCVHVGDRARIGAAPAERQLFWAPHGIVVTQVQLEPPSGVSQEPLHSRSWSGVG